VTLGFGNWNLEIGIWELEIGIWKLELESGIHQFSVVSGCDPSFQVGKGGSPPLLLSGKDFRLGRVVHPRCFN
jgi:hypothetical protein